MYKLVAIDLDETLLNDQHEVCERNKIVIQKALQKGVKIVPCSGRTPGLLKDLYATLQINNDDQFSILGNGSIVINNKSEDVLHCEPLDFDIAKSLFIWGRERNLAVEVYTTKEAFFFEVDEEEQALAHDIGNIHILGEHEFSTLADKEILKVIYLIRDGEYRKKIAKDLQPICQNKVTISFSSDRYLELNRLGIHKGIGLQALCEHLHIELSETMAIGDHANDLHLLAIAGLGVAMQNALESVKEVATYTTTSNNNEGGVAEAIEKFIL